MDEESIGGIKKRKIDLGAFWKNGLEVERERFIKKLLKDHKGPNKEIEMGKEIAKEMKKAYQNTKIASKFMKSKKS